MRERAAARTPCEGSGCHNFSIFARTSSATMALQSMREGVVCRWGNVVYCTIRLFWSETGHAL
jgi:hypothetical protein